MDEEKIEGCDCKRAKPSSAAAHAQETRSLEGREAEGEQSGTREHDETQGQWRGGCTCCANVID